MKILFVLTRTDEWGGAQVHIRDLSRALTQDGHDVVVAGGEAGHSAARLKDNGIRFIPLRRLVRSIRPIQDMSAVFELLQVLRAERPDVVSLHSSKAGIAGRLAARLAGVPVLFTAHGWAFTEGTGGTSQRLYKAIERCMAPFASRIVTVSEYDRRLALDARVGKPGKLVAVHNGMPDIARTDVEPGEDGIVRFVMVARFGAQKNPQQLLDALSALKGEPWQLEFIGDGESRAACEHQAESLGLSQQVVFSGQVDDVAAHLRRSDVFVLATNWEGLPRSIIEAMRAGLPVVATDVGGISEQVLDGENGYLVPRGDTKALTERLRTLLQNTELRQTMSRASRQRYEAEFTFERMYEKTLSIYKEVVENHV